mmetsp:Transcript_127417/g.368904  ORF Transcript_127417/g.368904 Transcript_127417/m.368904 type:complete len:281 (-) Transcript_127417:52-894(-)
MVSMAAAIFTVCLPNISAFIARATHSRVNMCSAGGCKLMAVHTFFVKEIFSHKLLKSDGNCSTCFDFTKSNVAISRLKTVSLIAVPHLGQLFSTTVLQASSFATALVSANSSKCSRYLEAVSNHCLKKCGVCVKGAPAKAVAPFATIWVALSMRRPNCATSSAKFSKSSLDSSSDKIAYDSQMMRAQALMEPCISNNVKMASKVSLCFGTERKGATTVSGRHVFARDKTCFAIFIGKVWGKSSFSHSLKLSIASVSKSAMRFPPMSVLKNLGANSCNFFS